MALPDHRVTIDITGLGFRSSDPKTVKINGVEVPIAEFSLSYDLDAEGAQIVNMGIIADQINIS